MERSHDQARVGSCTRIALHLATFYNAHVHTWPVVRTAWHLLDFAHRQHTLNDTAKYDMLAVEKLGWLRRDKKLASIAMWPCIRHAEQTRRIVLQYEILVSEFVTIDAKTASSITV